MGDNRHLSVHCAIRLVLSYPVRLSATACGSSKFACGTGYRTFIMCVARWCPVASMGAPDVGERGAMGGVPLPPPLLPDEVSGSSCDPPSYGWGVRCAGESHSSPVRVVRGVPQHSCIKACWSAGGDVRERTPRRVILRPTKNSAHMFYILAFTLLGIAIYLVIYRM